MHVDYVHLKKNKKNMHVGYILILLFWYNKIAMNWIYPLLSYTQYVYVLNHCSLSVLLNYIFLE